jgi:beta-lactamase regulating signal transducer with metallopeptidase domain
VDAVPLALLANAAAATGAAVVVAVVALVVRGPGFANRGWLVVLVKLITPPLVGLPVAVAWVADEPSVAQPEPAPSPSGEPVEQAPPPRPVEDPVPDWVVGPAGLEPSGDLLPVPREPDRVAPTADRDGIPTAEPTPDPSAPFPTSAVLVAVWLAGAVGWWALVAGRVIRFRRQLDRLAEPAPAAVVELAWAVAGRVGVRRVPPIAFVDADVSPMLWAGLRGPRLILPRRLWDALGPDQRAAVLAHELAHLARRDHWVRRLEVVVLGLYWWFPVAWLAARQVRRAEEACCDAWVVWALPGRQTAYAEALVEAVAFVSRRGWVPLASGGAARAGDLKRRLTMILSDSPRRRWPAGLAAAALAVAVLPWAPTRADDPPTPTPKPRPTPTPVTPAPPQAEPVPVPVPAGPAPVTPRSATKWNTFASTEEVERLKDELELLVVQRDTKRAMVRVAEATIKQAEASVNRLAQLVRGNAASREELDKAHGELEAAKAQLDVRKAELIEHEVKIAQAKRRLDRLTASPANPLTPSPRNVRPEPQPKAPKQPPQADLRAGPDDIRVQLAKLEVQMAELMAQRDELVKRYAQIQDELKRLKAIEAAVAEQADKLNVTRNKLMDLLKKANEAKKP